jgi:hypothetical protein
MKVMSELTNVPRENHQIAKATAKPFIEMEKLKTSTHYIREFPDIQILGIKHCKKQFFIKPWIPFFQFFKPHKWYLE